MAVVFDLDDTLYREADYQRSGFKAIARHVEALYGISMHEAEEELISSETMDPLARLCKCLGLPSSVKQSFLWIYRLHEPGITLDSKVCMMLRSLEKIAWLAILTDGRSVTQRRKIKALGLGKLPVYISEEYGAEKPDMCRFEQIMHDIDVSRYVYVADNPVKDFVAPNRLNWLTVGVRGDSRNVHQFDEKSYSVEFLPKAWVNKVSDLLKVLEVKNEDLS